MLSQLCETVLFIDIQPGHFLLQIAEYKLQIIQLASQNRACQGRLTDAGQLLFQIRSPQTAALHLCVEAA
ncbi:hypothetical protein D3C81_2281230 [compost metagenome]